MSLSIKSKAVYINVRYPGLFDLVLVWYAATPGITVFPL